MAKLGFLGLGIMGGPMARHLLEAGHEVALWSYSKGKAETLAKSGKGTVCATPAEVAERCDCVFFCVGDTEMSREVTLGAEGLAAGGAKGMVIVDCSTIAPSASREIAQTLKQRGFDYLDAPCTGSKAGAEGGNLTFMVGGPKEVFEKVRSYFEPMGKLLYYCGESGMGLHAKLSQNLIIGNLLNAFNESLVLSTKAGVPPELMLEILNNSAARSGLIAAKAPLVFARNFETHFSVKWLEKDMELMVESAAELGVPVPLTTLSRQLFDTAIEKGYGEDDICGAIRVLEDSAQCVVRGQDKVLTARS
jgi:3-hydroxyisobutyrate dehydrogenase-like beta-hydroxyacid dehydrogenase